MLLKHVQSLPWAIVHSMQNMLLRLCNVGGKDLDFVIFKGERIEGQVPCVVVVEAILQ